MRAEEHVSKPLVNAYNYAFISKLSKALNQFVSIASGLWRAVGEEVNVTHGNGEAPGETRMEVAVDDINEAGLPSVDPLQLWHRLIPRSGAGVQCCRDSSIIIPHMPFGFGISTCESVDVSESSRKAAEECSQRVSDAMDAFAG